LVVLVIIGLLVGLVGPRVLNYLGSARSDTAQIQIEQLRTAVELYLIDTGTLPSADQGLEALVRRPPGVDHWNGPYLQQNTVPTDPWGNAYQYDLADTGSGFAIYSLGADDAEGGDGEAADVGRPTN
jgi:general secretion pathway protein G